MKKACLKRLLPVVLGIAVLSLISVTAQADLIYEGINFDVKVSAPVNVGVTPLKALTLTVIGKNGALPNTFDSDKSGFGGTGITTVGDLLHQIWEFNVIQTPSLTLGGDPIPVPQDLDTHFLVEDSQIIVAPGGALTENKPTPYTTEDSRGGLGDSLTGTFTLFGAASTTWDCAYLVVPNGTEVFLDFEVGLPGYASETVGGSFTVVPEPSMLLLLALGAMGLLIKRGTK